MVLNMCRKIEQPSILRKRMTFPAMAQMEKPCDTPLLVMVVIYSNFQKKKKKEKALLFILVGIN